MNKPLLIRMMLVILMIGDYFYFLVQIFGQSLYLKPIVISLPFNSEV